MTCGPAQPRPGRPRCRQRRRAGGVLMPTMTAFPPDEGGVRLGPALSVFDPVFVGIDEFGHRVRIPLVYRNLLVGGEPGAGKSALLNLIVAHAALDPGCDLVLL